MFHMTEYYLSQADIGRHFGVGSEAVRGWRNRYADFPVPDAWIGVDEMPENAKAVPDARKNPRANSRSMPGWLPSSLKSDGAIQKWYDTHEFRPGQRTDLKRPGQD